MPDQRPPPGPASAGPARDAAGAAPSTVRTLAVAALLLLLFGPSTLDRELMPPDEPRFALVAAEMFERGDPVLPTRHGRPYLEKPPLLFWGAGLAFLVAGGPSEPAARLPSLLAAIVLGCSVHAAASRWYGPRTGRLAALCLATCSLLLLRAGWAVTDTLLAAAVFGCVAALDRARRAHRRSHGAAAALWLAAGLLAKGPVALLFVLLAAAASYAAPPPRLSLRPLARPLALALLAMALLPWPLALALRIGDPSVLAASAFRQTALRAVASWDNLEPWWYYGEALALGLLPWTVLLPALADRDVRARLLASPVTRWLVAWAGLSLLAFSLPAGKRGVYLLPVFPALACVAASILAAAPRRIWRRAVALAAALAGLPFGAVAAAFVIDARGLGLLPESLPEGDALRFGIVAVAGTWAAGLGAMALAASSSWRHVPAGPAAAALLLGLGAPIVIGPALDHAQGARAAARELERLTPAGETIGACRSKRELLAWYVARPLDPLDDGQDVVRFLERDAGVVVCRESQLPPPGQLPRGVERAGTIRIGRLRMPVLRRIAAPTGGTAAARDRHPSPRGGSRGVEYSRRP